MCRHKFNWNIAECDDKLQNKNEIFISNKTYTVYVLHYLNIYSNTYIFAVFVLYIMTQWSVMLIDH